MNYSRWKSEWGELAIISIVSFFLYQMNLLILFCIPLQLLFARKGERQLRYASIIVMVALGIASLIRTAPVEDSGFRRGLLTVEILLPAFILGGLVATNMTWKIPLRTMYKLFAVTAAAGLLSIPFLMIIGRSDGFSELIREQIDGILRVFQSGGEAEGAEGALPETAQLIDLILGILLRNYVFMYFLMLGGSIWIGRSFAARMSGGVRTGFRNLRVSDRMVWALLVPWAFVLLDLKVSIGAAGYAAWNVGMVLLLLYGLQGVGILQTLLDRKRVSRGIRLMLVLVLGLMLFWPGVNLLVIIGLPGLGVSELWIHYRKEIKE